MNTRAKLKTAALLLTTALGLGSYCSAADPGSQKEYLFKSGKVRFMYYAEKHLLISLDCRRKRKGAAELECKAYQAFLRSSMSGLVAPPGGADPGAVICTQRFAGQVETALNKYGNEASFCLLSDGSRVSTGSLDFGAAR